MASTENVGRMLVIGVVFFAFLSILLSMQTSEQNEFTPNPDSPVTLIGGVSYTFLTPSSGHAYTWTNATDNYYNSRTAQTNDIHFYYPDDTNPVRVSCIRNRTDGQGWFQASEWFQFRDFLAVEKSWGWWDWKGVPLSLLDIVAAHNATSSNNYVDINVTLDRDYIVRIIASSGATFTDDVLVDNAFTVKVLYITVDPTVLDPNDSGWLTFIWDFVSTIVGLMFGQILPGIPYIGWPLQIGLWVGAAYTFYMLIVRGIHGGG